MLPHCQVLSLNLPGGQGVLMTRERFAMLPKGAIFVNSARGSLVDEDALLDALKSGQVGAAGLDVFQKEPDYDTRLNELENTFLLPHIGSATIETRTAMAGACGRWHCGGARRDRRRIKRGELRSASTEASCA